MSGISYGLGVNVPIMFTTRAFATGIPTTLAGSPVIDIYENGSVNQITTAETLTVDLDGVTGFNLVQIVATTANGFQPGKTYAAVINTGTVGGVDVTGEVLGTFYIRHWMEYIPYYAGPRGPGVYYDDAWGNTNSVVGTDGHSENPNSTIASVITTSGTMNLNRVYIWVNSAVTLGATMADWEFVGIGAPDGNTVALASQDVSNSAFHNLTITGVQGGANRALYEDCLLGTATVDCIARRCGLTGTLTVANADDQIFDQCYSMAPGNAVPVVVIAGAAADVSFTHYSGDIELKTLHATGTVHIETDGHVIFNADCDVNCAVTLSGNMTITDNTAGMAALTQEAALNKNDIADALLNRDMSAVSDTTARSPLNALRFLRNLWSLAGTTLTVKKEDDSTTAWTATVTTDAAADPITGSDPA